MCELFEWYAFSMTCALLLTGMKLFFFFSIQHFRFWEQQNPYLKQLNQDTYSCRSLAMKIESVHTPPQTRSSVISPHWRLYTAGRFSWLQRILCAPSLLEPSSQKVGLWHSDMACSATMLVPLYVVSFVQFIFTQGLNKSMEIPSGWEHQQACTLWTMFSYLCAK